VVRTLLIPVRTLLTFTLGVFATIILGPTVIIVAAINGKSPMIESCARLWSRIWLAAAGSKLTVVGREHIEHSGSHVVVANHESVLDIMACFLAATPLPIRFLAKKELFKVPILAQAMRAVGIVEVDRAARTTIHEKVNQQAAALVASGRSLIIYPEGTRSRTGELLAFKKGAFTMAIAAQIPVLPMTIEGSFEAWPAGRWFVRGGPITVYIEKPIPSTGMVKGDVTRLSDESRAVIAARLARLAASPRPTLDTASEEAAQS
jgi:1-acyl-sn-glycerol-3-phosphate acyltransferase